MILPTYTRGVLLALKVKPKPIIMKNLLLIAALLFSGSTVFSQIAVMDVIQIKDGMENDYESIEAFVSPIQKEAINQGRKLGWYVMKRQSGGDLSKVEDKGIGDYVLINIYKDKAQRDADQWSDYLEIAKKVYRGKMSKSKVTKKFNSAINPRKDTRTYLLENIYYTKPGSASVGDVYYIWPAEQLNDEYEQFEMEIFRPMWEERILEGSHLSWSFNRVIDRSENAYQNISHIIFNKPSEMPSKIQTDFKTQKAMEMGFLARKGFDAAKCKIILMQN